MTRVSKSGGLRIEERRVENAREFVTIGPEHEAWSADPPGTFHIGVGGAFVRIEPPQGASDEAVATARRCAAVTALRVTVLPRRRAAVVLPPRERRPHRKLREVVLELVEEARVDDPAALAAFVEKTMAKRGI